MESDSTMSLVPLFPLPNVVLFPRAVLPLHIFEERYKTMTADALDGERLIAMALLREGWEKSYHQRPAIEPIVCIGRILSFEKLPDGKYNFLLQGQVRARVLREYHERPYRLADLRPLDETHVLEIDLENDRRRLGDVLSTRKLTGVPLARQFRELLTGPMPTADIADLAAFNLIEDVELKQALLADVDVRRRVGRVVEAMHEWAARMNPALYGLPVDPDMN